MVKNFCEDINSKIDYFLPLGMEEKWLQGRNFLWKLLKNV